MYETKEDLVIKVDLPGMNEKDVQVSITGDLLSLKGQRMEPEEAVKPEQYFRAERWTGRVERIFQLPSPYRRTTSVRAIARACSPSRCRRSRQPS